MSLKNQALIKEVTDYCYCFKCNKIKESKDLASTDRGFQCLQCKGYDLGEAGWVGCPYNKMSPVKCPTAGKGLINTANGLECMDRCFFRLRD